jgi:putative FmdB family regulatory protein
MPTYDYRCTKCGHAFEAFQAITAPARADCPMCGSPAKRMISSGVGLIFKGSGFYQTDYKQKDQNTKMERKKKESKTSVEPKSETKGDKKENTGDKKESTTKTQKSKD